jgi:hypothetical protein
MPLTPAALSTELQSIQNAKPPNEPAAIQAFSVVFNNYMLNSGANGIPLVPAQAELARLAMVPAMTGLNTAGAASIQAGCVAYWGALNVPGSYGASIAVAPPPGIAGLAAALLAVFPVNVAGALETAPACDAIAAAWHPLMLGGTATFPGPAVFPIL